MKDDLKHIIDRPIPGAVFILTPELRNQKNNRLAWIIAVCFAAFLSSWAVIACAEDKPMPSTEMKRCEEAYNAKNWKDAATWCSAAAEQGNADAQIKLGVMYYEGQGVHQNNTKALKCFRKAADQGNVGAQNIIGNMAVCGDTQSQILVGLMFFEGKGVSQNYAEALKWYRYAADKGDADAQVKIGDMYYKGQGVSQDYTEALKWYRKAAEQGYADAQYNIARMYRDGQGLPQDYAEASKWFGKAAEQGDGNELLAIGAMYHDGMGMPQDYTEAAKWLRKAAEKGNLFGQYFLGDAYYYGQGVPQDYVEAAKWYLKIDEIGSGFSDAQYKLGVMYYEGQGVPQDYIEAAKWFRKAAEQGNENAQFMLGSMFAEGKGVSQDYDEAVQWYRKAADQGNENAQFMLGVMCSSGIGVFQSGAAAADWYYKAGITFLKSGEKDRALMCVESIQDLKSQQHLNVPNYFLAEQLMQKIYGGASTAAEPPEKQPEISMGTAWPVAEGFVVTACHVVQGHNAFSLLTKNGKKLKASVAMRDTANDIALLEVEFPDNLPGAIPVATKQARVGDKVFTIGYPHPDVMGAEPKLTDGIISSLTGIGNDPRTYQISVPVQAGNSGGPLLNMKGEVIGIVISKLNAAEMFKLTNDITENVNYAVKISYLNALLMTLPDKHPIPVQPVKKDTLADLANRLERSVMIVVAR